MSSETEHSAGTTPPAVFNLPVTGEAVPADLVKVTTKITGHMMGREGYATSLEVKRVGAVIGAIVDEGDGGGAWFQPSVRGGNAVWLDYTEQMALILVEEVRQGADDVYPSSAAETLCDRLIGDALLRRDLDRKRSIVARVNGDNDDIRVYSGTWNEYAREQLLEEIPGGFERWVKGQGWETVS